MFILGKKLKMSQIWKDNAVVPVTVVEAAPNKVSVLRSKEKDGYEAVQLSLGGRKKEFKAPNSKLQFGETVDVSAFSEGDLVRVSGTSKGKGFQGVVKRHGFRGGPKTHGQKNRFRAPGSIGATAPQRVHPGRKMAGRMGGERATLKGLTVAGTDKEKNLIFIKGAVPGARGAILEIQKMR